jgi:hypothetical protein
MARTSGANVGVVRHLPRIPLAQRRERLLDGLPRVLVHPDIVTATEIGLRDPRPPDKGDRGYGVDERGCPIFADFQTACEAWDGTYSTGPVVRPSPSDPVTLAPVCDWASTDEETRSNAVDATWDLCPSGTVPLNYLNLWTGKAHVGCWEFPD